MKIFRTTRLSEESNGPSRQWALTLSDMPFQVNFDSAPAQVQAASPGHYSPACGAGDFRLELFLPLLGESLLVSFPLLHNSMHIIFKKVNFYNNYGIRESRK